MYIVCRISNTAAAFPSALSIGKCKEVLGSTLPRSSCHAAPNRTSRAVAELPVQPVSFQAPTLSCASRTDQRLASVLPRTLESPCDG